MTKLKLVLSVVVLVLMLIGIATTLFLISRPQNLKSKADTAVSKIVFLDGLGKEIESTTSAQILVKIKYVSATASAQPPLTYKIADLKENLSVAKEETYVENKIIKWSLEPTNGLKSVYVQLRFGVRPEEPMVSYIKLALPVKVTSGSASLLSPQYVNATPSASTPPFNSKLDYVVDLNSDHVINSVDVALFRSLTQTSDTGSLDFNHDSKVNTLDYSYLLNQLRLSLDAR